MALSPARHGVWLGLAAAGYLSLSACTAEDNSLFGTRSDPSDNDAGSGGEAAPGSGGSSAKAGASASGGAMSKGGSSGAGGDEADGGADASGGVPIGTGGTPTSTGGHGGTDFGGPGCVSGDKVYPPGASFPAGDGCNTCSCMAGGDAACTQRACGGGGAPGTSCQDELAAELAKVQACEQDEDCGVPIPGSSCGCTRNLVANTSADTSRVEELLKTCSGLGSTCDCPAADGFVCKDQRCAWNYVDNSACNATPVGRVCIRGIPISSGDRLEAGMKLELQARPSGCFSSSCTEADIAVCSVQSNGTNHEASAEFCLRNVGQDGGACTADCGGGGFATCSSEAVLTEGTHTLEFGGKTLEFQVPSVLQPDEGCIELDP